MSSMSQDYLDMIDDCMQRERRLSAWERGFIDSLSKQFDNGKLFTDKQVEKLESIWNRVTEFPT